MPQLRHDPGEPEPCADALEDDVARHLEDEVADEEQRGAEAVGGLAEAEVADHLQLGVGDVLPVDVGDQVHQAEERHEPPGDGGDGSVADFIRRLAMRCHDLVASTCDDGSLRP